MADISITAANVAAGTGALAFTPSYNAGVTITAGQAVYLDATTNTWKLAHAITSIATATVRGIALHASLAGQPLAVQQGGQITIGGTLTAGKVYIASGTNAGGICLVADLTTSWRTSILGVAVSATVLQLQIYNSLIANA